MQLIRHQVLALGEDDDVVDPNVQVARAGTLESDLVLASFDEVKHADSVHDIPDHHLVVEGLYHLDEGTSKFAVQKLNLELMPVLQIQRVHLHLVVSCKDQVLVFLPKSSHLLNPVILDLLVHQLKLALFLVQPEH